MIDHALTVAAAALQTAALAARPETLECFVKKISAVTVTAIAFLMTAEATFAKETGPAIAQFKTHSISLPGQGRGDYLLVDEASNRLFVTHASTVHILDLNTLGAIGAVAGLTKAAGVAVASNKGFASDAGGDRIVVFDPETGATEKILLGGKKPDSIFFDKPSGMIFVFNGDSHDVSVIDPKRAEVVKTIALGDAPEGARSDGNGRAYVNLGDEHAIAVIDTLKGEVIGKHMLVDCESPAALGIDTAHDRIFSSCENNVMKVVDAKSGRTVATLVVGQDPDGIIYDAERRRVIVGGRDGVWTIVDQLTPDRYRINSTYSIDPYAKTLAQDTRTGRIFSSTADLLWPPRVPGRKHLPDAKSGTFRLLVISEP